MTNMFVMMHVAHDRRPAWPEVSRVFSQERSLRDSEESRMNESCRLRAPKISAEPRDGFCR